MDIQISAAQGRGKTTLARAIANTQGGIIFDMSYNGSPIIVKRAIARKIVEARADVVIFDECEPWTVEQYKAAVQAARLSLRRNIVAIYCVLDGDASVASTSQAFIPFGFVNAGNVWVDEATEITPEQIEKLKSRNTFKADYEQLRAEQLRAAGIAVKSVDGITEQSVGDMAERSYSAEQLTSMARIINLQGNPADVAQLKRVCAHFGVTSVDILPPIFHATAYVKMLPIVERIKSRNSEPY